MKPAQRVLIAVENTPESERVAAYVGRMLAGTENCHIRLFHIVEPIGPLFTAVHGDLHTQSDAPANDPGTIHIEKAKEAARPVLARMAEILTNSGIDPKDIEDSWYTAAREDSLAHEILELAREQRYQTVVVGRTTLPWYRNLFHHHIGERLVKKAEGLTVWVVE